MAVGQHLTGRTSDGDPSAIISTSKWMPYLIGDLSNLSLTPESTGLLLTVFPFPSIPQALTRSI
jgi:hypothetical protein